MQPPAVRTPLGSIKLVNIKTKLFPAIEVAAIDTAYCVFVQGLPFASVKSHCKANAPADGIVPEYCASKRPLTGSVIEATTETD